MTSKHFDRSGRRRRSREDPTADGLFGDSAGRRAARKTLQLCSQAERAIAWALATELSDPLLSQLRLLEVRPYPDGSHLMVVLAAPAGSDLRAAEERLGRTRGRLGDELGREICRKRLPLLSFVVIPEEARHE